MQLHAILGVIFNINTSVVEIYGVVLSYLITQAFSKPRNGCAGKAALQPGAVFNIKVRKLWRYETQIKI